MTIDHKKMLMIGLLSIALLLWAYHFTRIEIEFPESYSDGVLVCSPEYNTGPGELSEQELAASWEQFVDRSTGRISQHRRQSDGGRYSKCS